MSFKIETRIEYQNNTQPNKTFIDNEFQKKKKSDRTVAMLEPNILSSLYKPLFLSQTVGPKFAHHNSSLVNIKYMY